MRLSAKQAHRYLALFIGLFVVIHFAAHFAALGGIEAQGSAMQWGRQVYRFAPFEVGLLGALFAQVAIGIRLLCGLLHQRARQFWAWVQILSGTYLAVFIVMHTSAALLTRWLAGIDTNFYWAAGTLLLEPIRYGFRPYYVLAVSALVGHILAALHFRRSRSWHKPALLAGPLAGTLIALAYSGAFYPVALPQAHIDYFKAYLMADSPG
ncbi:MAG: hypothetical protein ACO25F_07990 [Erythrobacter sp.]